MAAGECVLPRVVQACSSDPAFERLLDLLIRSLVQEAKKSSVTYTATSLSHAICYLILEHRGRASNENDVNLDLIEHASRSWKEALSRGEIKRIWNMHVTSSFVKP
eukprot:scaffold21290_cov52-Attheya_sp.AAC.1